MNKEQFKQHRLDLNLTRKELATKLKCKYRSIQAYELGQRNITDLAMEAYERLIIENKLKKGLDY